MTELGQVASTTRNGFGEFRDGSGAHAMLAGELINLALLEHPSIPLFGRAVGPEIIVFGRGRHNFRHEPTTRHDFVPLASRFAAGAHHRARAVPASVQRAGTS